MGFGHRTDTTQPVSDPHLLNCFQSKLYTVQEVGAAWVTWVRQPAFCLPGGRGASASVATGLYLLPLPTPEAHVQKAPLPCHGVYRCGSGVSAPEPLGTHKREGLLL